MLDFYEKEDQTIRMREINLTADQKTALEAEHKCAHNSRKSDRIKAILLRAEGWSLSLIAQALRKHERSIARYVDDYLENEKLESTNGGSSSKLNSVQTDELISHLTDYIYTSQQAIIAYIEKKWSVFPASTNGFIKMVLVIKSQRACPIKLI